MADTGKNAGRAALIALAITLGVIVVMWLAWDQIGAQKRQEGMEATVEQGAAPPMEPADVLPPTTNPTGQTGGTPADEAPPPDERPVSNND
jgi:hypothetical protein